MFLDSEEKAFNEGYRLALKRVEALENGEYTKDWSSSETSQGVYARREQELREQSEKFPVTTGIQMNLPLFDGFVVDTRETIFYGCRDSLYCNECFTKHWSTICVCGMSHCSKCGSALSDRPIEEKEYRKERH